jgi:hypothetical protein
MPIQYRCESGDNWSKGRKRVFGLGSGSQADASAHGAVEAAAAREIDMAEHGGYGFDQEGTTCDPRTMMISLSNPRMSDTCAHKMDIPLICLVSSPTLMLDLGFLRIEHVIAGSTDRAAQMMKLNAASSDVNEERFALEKAPYSMIFCEIDQNAHFFCIIFTKRRYVQCFLHRSGNSKSAGRLSQVRAIQIFNRMHRTS